MGHEMKDTMSWRGNLYDNVKPVVGEMKKQGGWSQKAQRIV